MTFKVGDRVWVDDPGLAALRDIFRSATGEDPPSNNIGTVDEVDGDWIFINFDEGGCAPYPRSEVRLLIQEMKPTPCAD